MICQCVHSNSERQHMSAADEDQYEDRACGRDFSSYASGDNVSTIGKRLHSRVGKFEFADNPACVGCDDTKEADAQHAWHKSKNGKGLWQRKDAQRNVLGKHYCDALDAEILLRRRLVLQTDVCLLVLSVNRDTGLKAKSTDMLYDLPPFTCLVLDLGTFLVAKSIVTGWARYLCFDV
jgi:hypothetical protein